MKSKIKSISVMVLLIASLFVGIMSIMPESHAATIYVPDVETTLQAAIDNATAGDTIHINATTLTLTSPVEVNKTVTIEGNGTANTIIDGNGAVYMVLNITAENVTIKNLTVTGATNRGINISANATLTPNNFTITNCYIYNNTNYGIYWNSGTYGKIVNCRIENNGNGDNEGGLYIVADRHGAIVGNTFRNNTQDGIYSTESSNYDTTVYHYNNFRNNSVYGIETASGGTLRAQYNCWYNDTAAAWGGVPSASGVDNASSGVIATPYYNGSVVDAGVVLILEGTHTYGSTITDASIVYHEAGHTYNPWLMAANFSTIPIGTASSHYTLYTTTYGAFNVSGRGQTQDGLATNDWLNLTFYYTGTDSLVKGLWHYNGTAWVAPATRGVNTTNAGSHNGYTWANFSSNPTSPVVIYLNHNPNARFTYTPDSPTAGSTVTFDGSTSTDTEDSGDLSTWHWNFGDDSDDETATGEKPTHIFDEAGTYTVKLTVTDWAGGTATTSHDITVTAASTGSGVSPGTGSHTLTINVVDTSGNGVSGVTVGLYSSNILVGQATTTNGYATFSKVDGVYTITATKSGYNDASAVVTVSSDTTRTLVLTGVSIAEAPVAFGLTFFGLAIAIAIILSILAMIVIGLDRNYRKYWYIPILIDALAVLFAIILPIAGLMPWNIWLIIAPIVMIPITLWIFWTEAKKYLTTW